MYIHKDKLEKALALLAEGKSTREVSKLVGLNFTQLQYVRRLTGLYIDIKAYEDELKRLREERRAELERLRRLDELIKRKTQEVEEVEHKVNEVLSFFREEVEAFLGFIENLKAVLERVKECLEGFVGALYTYRTETQNVTFGWISREKWEEAFKLSREWCNRLDEAIAFLKVQKERFERKLQA